MDLPIKESHRVSPAEEAGLGGELHKGLKEVSWKLNLAAGKKINGWTEEETSLRGVL